MIVKSADLRQCRTGMNQIRMLLAHPPCREIHSASSTRKTTVSARTNQVRMLYLNLTPAPSLKGRGVAYWCVLASVGKNNSNPVQFLPPTHSIEVCPLGSSNSSRRAGKGTWHLREKHSASSTLENAGSSIILSRKWPRFWRNEWSRYDGKSTVYSTTDSTYGMLRGNGKSNSMMQGVDWEHQGSGKQILGMERYSFRAEESTRHLRVTKRNEWF